MADKGWIRRTVDTKGRPCPLMGKKCPGTTEKCAFWLAETLTSATREQEPCGGCLLAWQYVIHHESVLESVRAAASSDKAATEFRTAGRHLLAAVATHGALIEGGVPLGLPR